MRHARYHGNPVVRPSQVKPSHPELRVAGVFNPAATVFNDEILLLLRVAERCPEDKHLVQIPVASFGEGPSCIRIKQWNRIDHDCDLSDSREYKIDGRMYLSSLSHFRLARSRDGIHFDVEDTPFMLPERSDEVYGVEDARICRIDDTWYITYTAVSENGFGVALATTRDWRHIERHGLILPPQNKNAVFFPDRIKNRYLLLHRPLVEFLGQSSIWIAESPDRVHFGSHRCLLKPRDNHWEGQKIGIGPEPLLTKAGWLILYHGCGSRGYALQLALLDAENPVRVLARTEHPFLKPEMDYEREGFFDNVVFCNGWVKKTDSEVLIYYGAADKVVGLMQTSVDALLNLLDV